jgi:hypothetical protein
MISNLEKYDKVAENIFKMLQENNLYGVRDLAENCNMEDRGEIRTILMEIKPLRSSHILSDVYQKLSNKLREGSKTGNI